jgi:hypothetical protein
MDAFSNIPDSQKGEFMRHLEDQQMKDSLRYESNELLFGQLEIACRVNL